MAAARVKGAQGRDYSAPDKVVTSVKHFAAYGEPEAGRDYNTTDMSLQRLWNFYLPPFKAAVDAGSDTRHVLVQRDQRRARAARTATPRRTSSSGAGASTASSRATTRRSPSCAPARGVNPAGGPCGHGVAEDGAEAAALALNAGTDSEMVSTNYRDFGRAARAAAAQVSMQPHQRRRPPDPADQVPRRALREPLRRRRRRRQGKQLLPREPRRRAQGRRALDGAAQERNGAACCRSRSGQVDRRCIGPLGDSAARHARPVVGPRRRQRRRLPVRRHARPRTRTRRSRRAARSATTSSTTRRTSARRSTSPRRWPPRRPPTRSSLALGETREMSGEAEARSILDLPGQQEEHDRRRSRRPASRSPSCSSTARPLTLEDVDADSPAILEAWFGGVEAGNAVADVVFGKVNPGGKLPGQLPAQRRPGADLLQPQADRPPVRPDVRSTTRATATSVSCAPLFEFGYGLSYTTFKVVEPAPELGQRWTRAAGAITVSADVTNTGRRRRRGRPALHPRPGREHLAAGAPPARLRACDAPARADEDRDAGRSTATTSASTTTRAASSWRTDGSTSTSATRPAPTATRRSFTVTGVPSRASPRRDAPARR